ncbi:TPA: hypothetical protein ACGCIB_005435 [Bacillus cereus]|nr:hypothetical protein [Bacillus cereus]MCS6595427.1 hypothetical protein [Bacillus cereus]MDZ4492041.1 hypothetical protein [Bacillus cereus]
MKKGQAQKSTIKKIKDIMKKNGVKYYSEIIEKNKEIRENNKTK